ncbi:hypothetical protein [Oceanobacillus sp. FSL K6-0251]|uniref:hypothetical protein n=1 Tax=Oceanobacillus sp. FSL K6-0251 TaxID=2921602 RepID=UPI0030FAE2DA
MIGLTERLKSLGFVVDVPVTEKGEYHYFYHAYVKDLSSNTSLIIEGYRKKGYPTYRFTFYKATYFGGGVKVREKVYVENASPVQVIRKVTSFISWMERSNYGTKTKI